MRTVLPVAAVAPAAVEALAARCDGLVLGWGPRAGYVRVDRFVLAMTPRGVPLMPDGVSVGTGALPPISGSRAWVDPGRVVMPGVSLVWDPAAPPVWDPCVRPQEASPDDVRARGRAIRAAAGDAGLVVDPKELLVRGMVVEGDALFTAARGLLGRGPGLTPEGDDVIAGTVATVRAFGPACGVDPDRWAGPLRELDLDRATTGLSATLLRLALRGHVIEPVQPLLDLTREAWRPAIGRLGRVGHSTGRAYAAAISGTASALAAAAPNGAPAGDQPRWAKSPGR
jgi:hypothetical protein